ncbi:RNA methyltransferase [Palleronia caenipelagi]|uniref:RNA methyltransferase n=1 Tax=Palleronia caenipelagi TaxID=2489174 RepID=A0A547Q684_9RHOB|nr:RNA methyltransferase [Palleronia caenipelagi]TRD21870.1 RNA methyltransferase [Palleronia caenipelagi]
MEQMPAFILVRPQMGENIGAAARAMLNFGLTDMRLVSPRDGWPNERAVALASGASAVLESARLADSIADAAEGCDVLFATTARPRDMTLPVHTPETAMAEARRSIVQGRRVGVLFGPERAGLENDDIARAQAVVTVPVNPQFASLNLAQCVLLMGYEWRRQAVETGAVPEDGPVMATLPEVERWAGHFEDRLEEAGFFFPDHKAAHMKRSLRNLWARMPLTRSDTQILHGALRQLVRRRD